MKKSIFPAILCGHPILAATESHYPCKLYNVYYFSSNYNHPFAAVKAVLEFADIAGNLQKEQTDGWEGTPAWIADPADAPARCGG